jgi:hypothetical protein
MYFRLARFFAAWPGSRIWIGRVLLHILQAEHQPRDWSSGAYDRGREVYEAARQRVLSCVCLRSILSFCTVAGQVDLHRPSLVARFSSDNIKAGLV